MPHRSRPFTTGERDLVLEHIATARALLDAGHYSDGLRELAQARLKLDEAAHWLWAMPVVDRPAPPREADR